MVTLEGIAPLTNAPAYLQSPQVIDRFQRSLRELFETGDRATARTEGLQVRALWPLLQAARHPDARVGGEEALGREGAQGLA